MKVKLCSLLIVTALLFACGQNKDKDNNTETANATQDSIVLQTLKDAFRWGYPMMAMTINNEIFYESTLNAFYNMNKAADEKSQSDKGFNAETLYSAGALDLSKEPVVFSMPPVGNRFIVFPIQDAWGNIDNVIGTRTEGNNGGNFLISGPGWNGEVPAGMKHFKVQTNIAFLPGRSMVKSLDDAKDFAKNFQNKYTITPLSRWGKNEPNPNRGSDTNPILPDPNTSYSNIIAKMTISEYFNKLNELLVKNPPYDYDKPVLEQFKQLGIGTGLTFDTTKLSTTVKEVFSKFMINDPLETAQINIKRGMTYESGKLTCRYKTNYWERYLQMFGGIGGNVMEDARYVYVNADKEGAALDGNNNYVLHFDAAQVPKTKAFWSLTLYNNNFYLPTNLALNRHVLNSSNQLKYNADGSIDFYFQPTSPGKDKESNWLPTPKEGYFAIMRMYWPNEDILSGKWEPPIPTKMSN